MAYSLGLAIVAASSVACGEGAIVGASDPVAVIDAPSQDVTITVGSAVDFQGSASDPDGTIASHAWAFGDGGVAAVEDPGSYTYGSTGSFTVSYRATDDQGRASPVATREVTVVANQAPTAAIDAPSQDVTITVGSAIDFQGSASDPDGTIASHAWAFGDGGVAAVEDPGSYTYGGTGSFGVTYQVTDDEGALSAVATRTVTVVANQAPTAAIDAPSQNVTITVGSAIDFQGSASDPDGTIASHAWAFGDGGVAAVEDPGSYTYGGTGSFGVTYQVTDDDGALSAVATRTVTVVANQAPVAAIDAPSQNVTITVGSAVDFQGSASDPDGTIASHAWAFGDGGVAAVEDPGSYTYGGTGSFGVTYQVTDDDGALSAVATRTVTVVANQAPVAAIDAPGQDVTITVGSAIDFQGSASDPDGTIASHAWAFGDGGVAAVEDPGSYTYGSTGSFGVTYQVTDDDGALSTVASRTVTVVASGTNYALRFYANGWNDLGRVKIQIDDPSNNQPGPPLDVGATDFTIEFWMRAAANENTTPQISCGAVYSWINGNIMIDQDRNNQGRSYGLAMAGGRITFGVRNLSNARTICGSTRVDDGQWHHIAVTRTIASGALQLFVDGVLDGGSASGPTGDISFPDDGRGSDNSDPFTVLGAEKHDAGNPGDYPGFSGWLDELRYSTVVRYTGSFMPPTSRFSSDASTAALYHFDEGQGNVITDTSGAAGGPSNGVRRVGGSPAGPAWVLSDAPTGGQ